MDHDIGERRCSWVDFAEGWELPEGDSEPTVSFRCEDFVYWCQRRKQDVGSVPFCQYIHDTPFRFNGHDYLLYGEYWCFSAVTEKRWVSNRYNA